MVEAQRSHEGLLRVRCLRGWASPLSSGGSELLRKVSLHYLLRVCLKIISTL
eukprot:COSAG05_NODE_49_length_24373_cov_16.162561_20_plen_52_part_00